MCPHRKEDLLGCIRKDVTSRLRVVTLPLYSAPVRHICSAGSISEKYTGKSSAAVRVLDHLTYNEQLKELVLFSLGKSMFREILSVFINTRWGTKEEQDILLSVVPGEATGTN